MLKREAKPKSVCFRRWSRKRYSILISLSKVVKIGVLCIVYSLVNKMHVGLAQTDTTWARIDTLEFEEVEVVGRRSQVASDISRMITVIHHDEIEKAGIRNILDLLEFVTNIDIRQRGSSGVQADASIRGSSFDHVMVLVNGVNLSDPQTGHFSLDLPIDHESVERIEVLEGPAARVLGPGAFMGAINIITRNGNVKNLNASYKRGKFGFQRVNLNTGFKTGPINHFFSASRSASNGYKANTDYTLYNFYYRTNIRKEFSSVDFQGGTQQKSFGAGGFYSPRFPNQYEETGTWFASLKASTGSTFKVNSQVYWRRKKDHFLLERSNPAFYENHHLTNVYGSQLNISLGGKYFTTTLGCDLRSENMLSNNMGLDNPNPEPVEGTDSAFYTKQYSRTNMGLFFEQALEAGKFGITAGAMINWNTGFPGKPSFFPGLDIHYKWLRDITFYASINRALHLPTFTDLFYVDPVHEGNIHLDPDRMFSCEGGFRYKGNISSYKIAGFYNSGKDIIDWLWSYSTNRYSPVNLKQYKVWGISSNFMLGFEGYKPVGRWISALSVNYLYLNVDKSIADSVSKYYNLKHKISLIISQSITKKISISLNISYQNREGEAMGYREDERVYFFVPNKPYWLIDGTLKYSLKCIQFSLEMTNILNSRYIDVGSSVQQGRWIGAGVVFRFLP